jgi:AcrR family transcriptional regulator
MSYVSIDERRKQLVAAAIAVMTREGIARMTTRRVADEAEVPLGTLHYCFETKEELLLAAVRELSRELSEAGQVALVPGNDLRANLERALHAIWNTAIADEQRRLCTYEVATWALRSKKHAQVARDQYAGYFETAGAMLLHAADQAGMEFTLPLETLKRWTLITFDGLMLAYIVDHDQEHSLAVLDTFISVLVTFSRPKVSALSR